jgi:hypothetical protein
VGISETKRLLTPPKENIVHIERCCLNNKGCPAELCHVRNPVTHHEVVILLKDFIKD